jgi:hypothetical protein
VPNPKLGGYSFSWGDGRAKEWKGRVKGGGGDGEERQKYRGRGKSAQDFM